MIPAELTLAWCPENPTFQDPLKGDDKLNTELREILEGILVGLAGNGKDADYAALKPKIDGSIFSYQPTDSNLFFD